MLSTDRSPARHHRIRCEVGDKDTESVIMKTFIILGARNQCCILNVQIKSSITCVFVFLFLSLNHDKRD